MQIIVLYAPLLHNSISRYKNLPDLNESADILFLSFLCGSIRRMNKDPIYYIAELAPKFKIINYYKKN